MANSKDETICGERKKYHLCKLHKLICDYLYKLTIEHENSDAINTWQYQTIMCKNIRKVLYNIHKQRGASQLTDGRKGADELWTKIFCNTQWRINRKWNIKFCLCF